MEFILKKEYIKKGDTVKPAIITLPLGECEVLINNSGEQPKENYFCHFTKQKTNCVLIQVGLGIRVCGDILITMQELGYNLANKDDWKRAKKEAKETILTEYKKLVSEKPDIFDSSKIDKKLFAEENNSNKINNMKEIVYNCHVCELDEISNGEDMNFSFIKDKGTGNWNAGRLSGLHYYKKGLFSSERFFYLCADCASLICDYCTDRRISLRGFDWFDRKELNKTYAYCDKDGNETGDNFKLVKIYISGYCSKTILNLLLNDIENFRNELQSMKDSDEEENKRRQQEDEEEFKRLGKLELKIIELLKEKNKKITVSDIDAFLKHGNIDEIKRICDILYKQKKISFAGNGRYFVLTEESEKKKETKPTKSEKSEEVDVKSELKKYKEMLDDDLITQDDYDAKKKELLGI